MRNRLEPLFNNDDEKPEPAATEKQVTCVIVSDEKQDRVVLSYQGEKLLWSWKTYPNDSYGLECPGAKEPIELDPLAAEAYICEEISQFLSLEGIKDDEVMYVDSTGTRIEGVRMNPPQMGERTFDKVFKKEKIKELYDLYLSQSDSLSEEIVGEAISAGVLKALLSLVNME
jgi:hypothetical protein